MGVFEHFQCPVRIAVRFISITLFTSRAKSIDCSSVAKDRAWFTDYTPFESEVGNFYIAGTVPVKGIGTVELQTKRSPNHSGKDSYSSLCLTNVLHAPSILCNIIGRP